MKALCCKSAILLLLCFDTGFARRLAASVSPSELSHVKNVTRCSSDCSPGTVSLVGGVFEGQDGTKQCSIELTTTPRYDVLAQIESYLFDGQLRGGDAQHKRLWPLSASDIIGFVLTILVLFIAAGGGIGGGGAIIPLYLLFLGFNTKVAVALGNITIVGGSLSNFVFNAPRRHSVFNRPLIDWDLILVMEPSTILGALIGGYINKVLPAWATTVLLAALLTFISWKLLSRGIITWKGETAEKEQQHDETTEPLLDSQESQDGLDQPQVLPQSIRRASRGSRSSHHHDSYSPLAYSNSLAASSSNLRGNFRRRSLEAGPEEAPLDGTSNATADSSRAVSALNTPRTGDENTADGRPSNQDKEQQAGKGEKIDEKTAEDGPDGIESGESGTAELDDLQKELDDRFAEKRQIPPIRFGIMVLLTAVVAASDYFKGRVKCGTWLYWLLVLLIIPVVGVVTVIARSYLLRKRKIRAEAGYVWRQGDVDWNPVTTLVYPAICSVAGLVAGMFGVGGGIVKMRPSHGTLGFINSLAIASVCPLRLVAYGFAKKVQSVSCLSWWTMPFNNNICNKKSWGNQLFLCCNSASGGRPGKRCRAFILRNEIIHKSTNWVLCVYKFWARPVKQSIVSRL